MPAITASTATTATVQQSLAADAIWASTIHIDTAFGATTSSASIGALPYQQATGIAASQPTPLKTADVNKAAANIGSAFAAAIAQVEAGSLAAIQAWVTYNTARQADVVTAQAAVTAAATAVADAVTARNAAFAALQTARVAVQAAPGNPTAIAAVTAAQTAYATADTAWSTATTAQSTAQATLVTAQAALADPANAAVS